MRSKLSAQTSCEGCVFAKIGQPDTFFDSRVEENQNIVLAPVQIGCECDRIDAFVERGEAAQVVSDPYFQLTRLCNTYRDKEWADEAIQQTEGAIFLSDLADLAYEEVMPTFGIAIQDHPDATIDDLRATLESIRQIDYPKSKMKPVISTFSARGINNVMHEVNVMKDAGHINTEAIFHVVFEPKIKDTEVFKKLVRCQYFVNVFSGSQIDTKTFMDIHRSVNGDLEQIVMFESERGYNIISKAVVQRLYLTFNNYEATVDHIRQLAKDQNVYKQV